MEYALLLYAAPGASDDVRSPADDGVIDSWVAYTEALKAAGVLVTAEQLRGVDTATAVRVRGGERLLTDGPFIETKEHLLGFYLLDVPDLDTALTWAGRTPLSRYGTVEVRPVIRGVPWRATLE